jgi:hypothetical protein
MQTLDESLREVFIAKLQEKNSWGKKEIQLLFEQCCSQAILLAAQRLSAKDAEDPSKLRG